MLPNPTLDGERWTATGRGSTAVTGTSNLRGVGGQSIDLPQCRL
jgi:hypothetical protein